MAQPDVPEWNPDDKTPGYVYIRLADHIQARIARGDYPPGGMLPNEREMVPEYGVSIDTVRRAIGELRRRGVVETFPSKGTYVTQAELSAPPPRLPAPPDQDAPGCILICPDRLLCVPLASPGMTEDDEGPWRIPLRNSEYRYVQVADDLEARIRSGEFPYDSRLPRRDDLAAEYGVGEMTVRHALQVLAERGMVRPMPSVGTVVIWALH